MKVLKCQSGDKRVDDVKSKGMKLIVAPIILFFIISLQMDVFAATYSFDADKQYDINANIKLKTNNTMIKTDGKILKMVKGQSHIDGTDYVTLSSGSNPGIDIDDNNIFQIDYDRQPGYFDIAGVIFDTTGQNGKNQIITALNEDQNVQKSAAETIFKDTDFSKKNIMYYAKRTLGLANKNWYYGADSADFSVDKDESGSAFNVTLDNRVNDVVAQRTFKNLDLSQNNSMELQYTLDDPSIQQISVNCRIDFEGNGRSSSDLLITADTKTIEENRFLFKANIYELAEKSFPDKKNYYLREIIIHMQKKEGVSINDVKKVKYTLEKFSIYNDILDENLALKVLDKIKTDNKKVTQYLFPLDEFIPASSPGNNVKMDLLKVLQDKQVDTDGLKINNIVILLKGEEYFLTQKTRTLKAAFCSEQEVEYPSILDPYVQSAPESSLQSTGLNQELYQHVAGYKESFENSDSSLLSANAWTITSNNGTAFSIPDYYELKYEDKANSEFDIVSMEKKVHISLDAVPAGEKLYGELSFNLENPEMYEKYVAFGSRGQDVKEINLDVLPYKESNGYRNYTLDFQKYLSGITGSIDNFWLILKNKGGSKHFSISINTVRFYTENENAVYNNEKRLLQDALAFTTSSLSGEMMNGWEINTRVPFRFDCGNGKINFELSGGSQDYLSLSRNIQVNIGEKPYFMLAGSAIQGNENVNVKFDLDIEGINRIYTTDYKLGSEIDLGEAFGKYWDKKNVVIKKITVYLSNKADDQKNNPVYSLSHIEFYSKQKTGLIDFLKTQSLSNGTGSAIKLRAPEIASSVEWYKIDTDKNDKEMSKEENLNIKVLFDKNIIDTRQVSASYNMIKQHGKSVDLESYPTAGFTYTMDDPNVQQIIVRFQVDTNEDGVADGIIVKSVIASKELNFKCNVLEEARRLWPEKTAYKLLQINLDFKRNENQSPALNGVYGFTVTKFELHDAEGKVSLYDTLMDFPVADVDGKVYLLRNAIEKLPQKEADEFLLQLFKENSAWITLDTVKVEKGQHEVNLLSGQYMETDLIEFKEPVQDQAQGKEPSVKFTKINPTRYLVDVTAENSFWLVFSESFHKGWKAYILDNSKSDYSSDPLQWSALGTAFMQKNARTEVNEHQMVNGYANGWWVDIGSIQKEKGELVTFQMILEYKPQQLFELGVAISSMTLLLCITYLFREFIKKRKKKHESKN